MRANRLSGSEGGAGANPLFLPLSMQNLENESRWALSGRYVP